MGKKKRDYYLPKELEPSGTFAQIWEFLFTDNRKIEEKLQEKTFIEPKSFAEHLDFFLRYCTTCEHSTIDIDIYTEDKEKIIDGKTILHKRGEITMDVENISGRVYQWDYMREGCIKEVYSFIYRNPNYEWLGGEYTQDRLRFHFYEPDCWILNVPWQDWDDILKEYGRDSHVWHHFLISNPGNIRIGCGEIDFEDRRMKQQDFWAYINKNWSR